MVESTNGMARLQRLESKFDQVLRALQLPKSKSESLIDGLMKACIPLVFALIGYGVSLESRVSFLEKIHQDPDKVITKLEATRKELSDALQRVDDTVHSVDRRVTTLEVTLKK